MEVISRSEAKAKGLTRYYTGQPCKRGHVADRNVASRSCGACFAAKMIQYHAANTDKTRAYNITYNAANAGRLKANRVATAESRRAYNAEWRRLNPEKRAADQSRRRATKLAAVAPDHSPAVDTLAHYLARIMSELRGEPYHVDHVIPLARGGEHHARNLCVVPASYNASKGAKIDPQQQGASLRNTVLDLYHLGVPLRDHMDAVEEVMLA